MLWPLGILVTILVYFSNFALLYEEKSGNPGTHCSNFNESPTVAEDKIGLIEIDPQASGSFCG
jgi:polyferredoxin